MDRISNFLQKFLNLENNNKAKISAILDAIKNITGLELSKDVVEIKGDKLKLNCNPVFRNEIFMHKSEIEEKLRSTKIFLNLI